MTAVSVATGSISGQTRRPKWLAVLTVATAGGACAVRVKRGSAKTLPLDRLWR